MDFDNLSEEQATVVASVAFQYGDLETETENFWKYITSNEWKNAYRELMNFGDRYSSRRKEEAKLLLKFLNKKFNFFPKIVKFDSSYLIIEYIDNDKEYPASTNEDFLESIIKIHKVSNKKYGFDFNTQIAALEQINDFEDSWTKFFIVTRLNPMFELANKNEHMGNLINNKINNLINKIENFIPNNPPPLLLHGDMWEGNILFKEKRFVGFIDPGSFFGHNEMEVAYLRWFNPAFVDLKFLDIF